jgi:hypothetical protein
MTQICALSPSLVSLRGFLLKEREERLEDPTRHMNLDDMESPGLEVSRIMTQLSMDSAFLQGSSLVTSGPGSMIISFKTNRSRAGHRSKLGHLTAASAAMGCIMTRHGKALGGEAERCHGQKPRS